MKKLKLIPSLLLFGGLMMGITFSSCSKDDENNNGGNNGSNNNPLNNDTTIVDQTPIVSSLKELYNTWYCNSVVLPDGNVTVLQNIQYDGYMINTLTIGNDKFYWFIETFSKEKKDNGEIAMDPLYMNKDHLMGTLANNVIHVAYNSSITPEHNGHIITTLTIKHFDRGGIIQLSLFDNKTKVTYNFSTNPNYKGETGGYY